MNIPYIIVIGSSGVGKSTFCDFLSKISNLKVANCGDILKSRLDEKNIIIRNRSEIGSLYLSIFSEDDVSKEIYNHIKSQGCRIIDGVRLESTIKYFESRESYIVIYIERDNITEYSAIISTNDFSENKLTKKFDNMNGLIKYAKYSIINNKTLFKLDKITKKIWEDILTNFI